MKPIRDIRFFKSVIPNTDGHSLPSGMNNPSLTVSARRIALSLREHGFSLGDFDHLYINLTTCPVQDGMALAGRSKDPYHPWYRYYDMSVTPEVYGELEELSDATELISRLTRLLVEHFATDDFGEEKITAAVRQALDEGADMRIFYKEKKTATRTATVYLRLSDDGCFLPLLRVTDEHGTALLEADLPETVDLFILGEIQVSRQKVTIKPKKNALTEDMEPLSFVWA